MSTSMNIKKAEARRALLADPRRVSPDIETLISEDAELEQLRQQLLNQNTQLAQAFDAVTPPPGLSERLILHTRYRRHSRLMASVAAVAAVIVVATVALLMAKPQIDSPLALAMLDHVIEAKYELDDDGNVAPDRVKASLAAFGVQYRDIGYRVRHLADCMVAGRLGKHLIVNTPNGIVSFIILPDNGEALRERQKMGKGAFQAVFVPQPRAAYGAFASTTANNTVSPAEMESMMQKMFSPVTPT